MSGSSEEAEALGAAAFDAAPDALVVAGQDGIVLALNRNAERMLGWPGEAARGMSVEALLGVAVALLVPGPPSTAAPPTRLRDRNGRSFPAAVAVASGVDPAPVVIRVRDLSGEAAAEASRAATSNAVLGGIAHELNNPLAVLLAQATLLRDKATDPAIQSRAAKIEDAARRAGRLVRDLLTLAQHRAPVLAPLDLERAVDEALDRAAPGLRAAGIATRRSRAPGLAPTRGDGALLAQVIDHLLVSATTLLQARPGDRRLTVVTSQARGRAEVAITIEGAGEWPVRTDAGIGLAMCRSIVAAHDGFLALRTPPQDEAPGYLLNLPQAAVETTPAHAACRPLAILVVDDEAEVAEALAELIAMSGHTVTVEASAEAALSRVRQQRFDGIFTDLHMPGLDGLAFRHAVAAENSWLAARTAIVSGDDVHGAGDPAHAPDLLTVEKPFTAAAVEAALTRMAIP